MIDPARQAKLDDPVLLDTVSTVLSGFIAVWDEPTKQAIRECTSEQVTGAAIQSEILYLRAFTIVFGVGQVLGDTKVKTAILDRFQGRVVNLLPDATTFLERANDYATAVAAAGPDDVARSVGLVFSRQCGMPEAIPLVALGEKQYAALSAVLPEFFQDATR